MNLYLLTGLFLSAILAAMLAHAFTNWFIGMFEGTEKHDDEK
jgi:hypothetical protein